MTSPLLCFFTVQLFLFLALVTKPSSYRCLFMVPILLAVASVLQRRPKTASVSEYSFTSALIVQFFSASDYILLTDVQRELSVKGQKVPAYQLSLCGRIKWAARLYFGCRGVGWSHEPTYALPPRPSPPLTRLKFLLQELRRLALDLAVFEVATTYTRNSPSFAADGYSIAEDGIFWLTVNVIVYGISAIVSIDMTHRVLGILCVGLGAVEPSEWVPLFGSLYDAYSLRNFWGRVWHQILRRQIISHGHFLAYNVLFLKRKSLPSLLVQLYVGFTISALIHFGAEYSMLGHWSSQHALRFFFLQAVGVTIEIIVIETSKRLSIRRSWYWLGYFWVLSWFLYTLPGWVDPLFRAGMVEATSNFGLLENLLKRSQWL